MRFYANFHDDGSSFDASASETGSSFDAAVSSDNEAFGAVVDGDVETFPASVRDDDSAFGVDFVGYVENNTGGGAGIAAVLYTPMELNEAQQRQARENIGALDRGFETFSVLQREDGTYFANVAYRELIQHLAAGKAIYAMLDGVRYPLVQSAGTWLYFGKMDLPSGTGTTWHYTYIGINSSDKVQVTKPQIPISAITLTGLDRQKLLYVNSARELESLELDEVMRIEDGTLMLDETIKQPGPQGTPGTPGKDGARGTGILTVEHSPFDISGTVDGIDYTYVFNVGTVKEQAQVDAVYSGDYIMRHGRYLYRVVYVDESFAYVGPQIDLKGQNGISVTHKWYGTTLEVNSASGVSSADLKGPRGEAGPAGERGEAGPAGVAGERGTGIYKISSEPDAYTGTVNGTTAVARWTTPTQHIPGDLLMWKSTLYHVYHYANPYAYIDSYYSVKGEAGEPGKDGESVTVSSVIESTEDGGENIVTFSDGTVLIVRNGNKGSAGEGGSGGSGVFLVTVRSKDTSTTINGTYPVSHTASEIWDAYSAGQLVVLTQNNERYDLHTITSSRAEFVRFSAQTDKTLLRKTWTIGSYSAGRAEPKETTVMATNPNPLTINGKSYDGSAAVNLDVGGGEGIIVNITCDENMENWMADKQHAELLAAAQQGLPVYGNILGLIAPVTAIEETQAYFAVEFNGARLEVTIDAMPDADQDAVTGSFGAAGVDSGLLVVKATGHIEGDRYTVSHTSEEIANAHSMGQAVILSFGYGLYTLSGIDSYGCNFTQFIPDTHQTGFGLQIGRNNTVSIAGNVATWSEANVMVKPHPLTINGTLYDGSKAVEVNIEGGSGGIHVGSEAPADDAAVVWIDPSADADIRSELVADVIAQLPVYGGETA